MTNLFLALALILVNAVFTSWLEHKVGQQVVGSLKHSLWKGARNGAWGVFGMVLTYL